jgi:hypothetical protein
VWPARLAFKVNQVILDRWGREVSQVKRVKRVIQACQVNVANEVIMGIRASKVHRAEMVLWASGVNKARQDRNRLEYRVVREIGATAVSFMKLESRETIS